MTLLVDSVEVWMLDYSDQLESFELPIQTPYSLGDLQDFVTQTDLITSSDVSRSRLAIRTSLLPDDVVPPTSVNAQNENKWIVYCQDTSTLQAFQFYVPGADLSLLLLNSNFIDLSNGDVSDWIDLLEDNFLSPQGNAFTVSNIALAE